MISCFVLKPKHCSYLSCCNIHFKVFALNYTILFFKKIGYVIVC